jgi:uncharacterized SAM-binding protein YcdF (DUF218 family)
MSPGVEPSLPERKRMKGVLTVARWLRTMLAAIGLVTVVVTFTPLVSWWARAYAGSIELPKGDVLILLSAAGDDNSGISYSSYWRARQALIAWQTGGFKRIVVSGGGGPGIVNFLASEGIPRDVIVAEWGSKSTRENGMATARLIQGMPGRKVLVTSDFHMYRALRVFRKLNIQVTPMAVPDVLHSAERWTGRFQAFETMLVESAKILDYAVRGWI